MAVDELTALAIAARDGDRVALRALVRATHAEVWRVCAHLAGREAADDLAQDVYLRAVGALPAFRAEASARTWLLGIARRAAADAIRGEQRWRRLTRMAPVSRDDGDASAEVEFEILVRGLDEQPRAAFVLTQLVGLTYAEAAVVCGCPIGTVRSRVARARETLRAAVSDVASG